MTKQMISVGRVAASDIREASGTGLFFPVNESEPTLLLLVEPGSRHAIKLTGSDRYNRFPVGLRTACAGLLIPDVEIRVDLSSKADAAGLTDKRGTLILSHDAIAMVTGMVGDDLGDPEPFRLPFPAMAGCDATRIAFGRWSLGIVQDDEWIALWERADH